MELNTKLTRRVIQIQATFWQSFPYHMEMQNAVDGLRQMERNPAH